MSVLAKRTAQKLAENAARLIETQQEVTKQKLHAVDIKGPLELKTLVPELTYDEARNLFIQLVDLAEHKHPNLTFAAAQIRTGYWKGLAYSSGYLLGGSAELLQEAISQRLKTSLKKYPQYQQVGATLESRSIPELEQLAVALAKVKNLAPTPVLEKLLGETTSELAAKVELRGTLASVNTQNRLGYNFVQVDFSITTPEKPSSTLVNRLVKETREYLESPEFALALVRERTTALANELAGTFKAQAQKPKTLVPKKALESAKVKSTQKKPVAAFKPPILRDLRGRFTSLNVILQQLNSSLHDRIKANMGTGKRKDILNYRTGRFARSARVERLTQSREGMITAFYDYMKYPYATFSQGGEREFPRSRDPKLLIAKSIREIVQERVSNRLRAVLV
jgi:hypothetical protein